MYHRHATEDDILLVLQLNDPNTNTGVTGATPKVAIQRVRASAGGATLDGWYWNGTSFAAPVVWNTLTPTDAVNKPGEYSYLFEQSQLGQDVVYSCYFKNETDPIGFAVEEHVVENALSELTLASINDIWTHATPLVLKDYMERVLGLLHRNALLDLQTYDVDGQLTSARLRVFDSVANIPAVPGGSETVGLIQKYEIEASYSGPNVVTKFTLRQVL